MLNTELDYLSVVDPGFASVVWPVHDAHAVIVQDNYLEQIRRIFRFNLLWRRSVIIRHIDLFNNIALMRFILTREALSLTQAGCLQLTVPNSAPVRENFDHWALGSGSQHWHHFSPERQKAHDKCFEHGEKRSLSWLEEELGLDQYDLELSPLLRRAESLFRERRHVLKYSPPPEKFSIRALSLWHKFLLEPRQSSLHDPYQVDKVSELFALGAIEQWRRRRFFTKLDALEPSPSTNSLLPSAVVTAKLAAVNQAFYDEFEALRHEDHDGHEPIAVSRNITYLAQQTIPAVASEAVDLYSGTRLRAIDTLDLHRIAMWHNEDSKDAESRAFRESIARLAEAQRQPQGSLSSKQIEKLVDQHVEVINNCIDRAVVQGELAITKQDQLIKAFPTRHTGWVQVGVAVGSSILSNIVSKAADLHGARDIIVTGAFTLASTLAVSPLSRSRSWENFEATIKQHVRTRLEGDPLAYQNRSSRLGIGFSTPEKPH